MKTLLKAGLLGLLLGSGGLAAETLVVAVHGLNSNQGNLRVSLYRDPETFRKEDQALSIEAVPAMAGDVSVRFEDLEPGRYAIMAYHDEDADGEMKRRFGMFPLEGYGLSNNPEVFGPPAFEDSAFEVVPGEEAQVRIEMRY